MHACISENFDSAQAPQEILTITEPPDLVDYKRRIIEARGIQKKRRGKSHRLKPVGIRNLLSSWFTDRSCRSRGVIGLIEYILEVSAPFRIFIRQRS